MFATLDEPATAVAFQDEELSHGAIVTLHRLRTRYAPGQPIPLAEVAHAGRNRRAGTISVPSPTTHQQWCRELEAHGLMALRRDRAGGSHWVLAETAAFTGPAKTPAPQKLRSPINNYPEGVIAPPTTETSKTGAKPHSGEAAGREAPSRRRLFPTVNNLGNKRRRGPRHAGAQYLAAAERVCQETLGKHPASMSYTVAMMVDEFNFSVADATQWLIARGSRATGRRGQSLKKADVRHALENPPLPVPDTPPAGHTPPPVDAETARATLTATPMHAPTKAGLLELLRVRPDAAALPNLNQRFLQEVLSLDWEPTAAQVCAGVRRLARAREVDLTMLGSEMWSAREDAMAW